MRADIYEPGNAEKVFSAIRQIKEATGIELSPNRVVNLMIAAIDSIESVETLGAILRKNSKAIYGGRFERKRRQIAGFLYLMQLSRQRLFKIGITTKTPKQRLKQLQVGAPGRLRVRIGISVSNAAALERRLHRMFKEKRLRKRGEWFRLSEKNIRDIVAFVKSQEENPLARSR